MNNWMRKVKPLLVGICLFALLGLSACASQVTTTGTTQGINPPTSLKNLNATVGLLRAPQGTADLSWDPNLKLLTVSMSVSGLAPGSSHPTHIHLGVCNTPGAMLYALPALQANDLGQATLRNVIIHQVAHLPTQGWLINVHNGPTMASTQGQNLAIACGTLTMKENSAQGTLKEHVVLQGTTAPNESASGTVQVSFDAATGTLSATVKVHGLQPGSRHAVHIHEGTCEKQGKMLYPLPTLVADGNGDATSSTTINVTSLPASLLYVNVHFAETITTPKGAIIQEAFNPILCGNLS